MGGTRNANERRGGMNRAVVVAVTCLVLVSSVVPVSALSHGATGSALAASEESGPAVGPRSASPGGPDPGTASLDASTTATTTTAAASSGKSGNTGFEDHYYYLAGLVNAANGNLYLERSDLSTGARGGDITFARSYNSLRSGEHGSRNDRTGSSSWTATARRTPSRPTGVAGTPPRPASTPGSVRLPAGSNSTARTARPSASTPTGSSNRSRTATATGSP